MKSCICGEYYLDVLKLTLGNQGQYMDSAIAEALTSAAILPEEHYIWCPMYELCFCACHRGPNDGDNDSDNDTSPFTGPDGGPLLSVSLLELVPTNSNQ